MVILKHMLLLLPFLWDFTSQFPLSVLSWLLWSLFWWLYSSVKWFSRVWMWTILCLLLLPFGEREEKHRDRWRRHEKARVLMGAPPLSNWGKANMIKPNLKDDLCLPPQRRSTVMHALLDELLRGRPVQFKADVSTETMDCREKFIFPSTPIPKLSFTWATA